MKEVERDRFYASSIRSTPHLVASYNESVFVGNLLDLFTLKVKMQQLHVLTFEFPVAKWKEKHRKWARFSQEDNLEQLLDTAPY